MLEAEEGTSGGGDLRRMAGRDEYEGMVTKDKMKKQD